jgi:mono/diheme cytochrome c family protein
LKRLGKFHLSVWILIAMSACAPSHSVFEKSNSESSLGLMDNAEEQSSLNILNSKCLPCHGPSGSGGLANIGDVSTLISGGWIIPGQPNSSPLIEAVTAGKGTMPLNGSLTATEYQTLYDWVLGSTVTPPPPPTPMPTPTPSPSPSPTAPTFTQVSTTILQPLCVGCHTFASSYAGISAYVKAGDPSTSLFYTETSSGAMPKGGPVLTAAQLQMISDWITAGGLNN